MKRAVIRLPSEVVDRLDRLAAELRAAHPEESYSRASVVRALISSGLLYTATHEERRRDVARRAARTAPRRAGGREA
jgi:predicted transcriptional regulator